MHAWGALGFRVEGFGVYLGFTVPRCRFLFLDLGWDVSKSGAPVFTGLRRGLRRVSIMRGLKFGKCLLTDVKLVLLC